MSAADNKKLVQQIYADSANRSGTTFADNLADDASWIVTGQYSWSHEFKGKRCDPERPDGPFPLVLRRAAAHGGVQFHRRGRLCRGRGTGDNVTKAGLRYDNQYCMVFRIENGKIKEIKEYCDSDPGRTRARAVSGSAQACGGLSTLNSVCAGDRRHRRGDREPAPVRRLPRIAAMLALIGRGETAAGSGVNSPS